MHMRQDQLGEPADLPPPKVSHDAPMPKESLSARALYEQYRQNNPSRPKIGKSSEDNLHPGPGDLSEATYSRLRVLYRASASGDPIAAKLLDEIDEGNLSIAGAHELFRMRKRHGAQRTLIRNPYTILTTPVADLCAKARTLQLYGHGKREIAAAVKVPSPSLQMLLELDESAGAGDVYAAELISKVDDQMMQIKVAHQKWLQHVRDHRPLSTPADLGQPVSLTLIEHKVLDAYASSIGLLQYVNESKRISFSKRAPTATFHLVPILKIASQTHLNSAVALHKLATAVWPEIGGVHTRHIAKKSEPASLVSRRSKSIPLDFLHKRALEVDSFAGGLSTLLSTAKSLDAGNTESMDAVRLIAQLRSAGLTVKKSADRLHELIKIIDREQNP